MDPHAHGQTDSKVYLPPPSHTSILLLVAAPPVTRRDTLPSATAVPFDVTPVQSRVLRLFARYGDMDDYQLIERYRDHYEPFVSESTPRTRRRELADQGQLAERKVKNIGRSGLLLSVWGIA